MIDYPYGKENVQTAGLKAVINAMDGETVVFPYDDETPFTLGIKAILERIDASGGGSGSNKIVELQPSQVIKRTVDRLGTVFMVSVDDLANVNNGDFIVTSGYTDYATSSTVTEALLFTLNNIDNPGEFDGDSYAWLFDNEAIVLQGNAGVSPTVATATITGGHSVTITDANGSHAFNVLDGSPGTQIYNSNFLYFDSQTRNFLIMDNIGVPPASSTIGDYYVTLFAVQGEQYSQAVSISKVEGTAEFEGVTYPYTRYPATLSYTLTQQDKQDIAALVAQQYTNGDTTGY